MYVYVQPYFKISNIKKKLKIFSWIFEIGLYAFAHSLIVTNVPIIPKTFFLMKQSDF